VNLNQNKLFLYVEYIMNSLLQGKENIFQIKERVNSRDPTYFCHFMLNESKIDENTNLA
jgi:hypothetical protein